MIVFAFSSTVKKAWPCLCGGKSEIVGNGIRAGKGVCKCTLFVCSNCGDKELDEHWEKVHENPPAVGSIWVRPRRVAQPQGEDVIMPPYAVEVLHSDNLIVIVRNLSGPTRGEEPEIPLPVFLTAFYLSAA